MNNTEKDLGEEIISSLKELNEQLDGLINALKDDRKKLSNTLGA